ncbi:RHS repeat domain-containing protein [Bacteriovorax sp. DB6_IX]|uniref:RHS repeat domain-containing protein n=1 Tax=Bacteriovorax sp. DB6_IX TaxID=1353530 RepID=UPI00350EFB68
MDAESGLNNCRARYYSPEIGRFISEDPILHSKGQLNSYRYVFKFSTQICRPYRGVIYGCNNNRVHSNHYCKCSFFCIRYRCTDERIGKF